MGAPWSVHGLPKKGVEGYPGPGWDLALDCPWGSSLEPRPRALGQEKPREPGEVERAGAQLALHVLGLRVFDAILSLGPVPKAKVILFSKQLWPKSIREGMCVQ